MSQTKCLRLCLHAISKPVSYGRRVSSFPKRPDTNPLGLIFLKRFLVFVCMALFVSADVATADEVIPNDPPLRWWKGNIHTHTFWSDGNDFPEMVAEWYRTHGYNFLALSDHNIMSLGDKWIGQAAMIKRLGADAYQPALDNYFARFGRHWVETRGEPGTETFEVRLQPLDEFRALVEQRGEFIMMPGEEITDNVEGAPVHMNATNLQETIQPLSGSTIREAIAANLRAVEQQARRTGREILTHVNHPNYKYAITPEDLAAVFQERFVEVFNGHPAVNHQGDDLHPGVERMWDIANTIRLDRTDTPPLYGIATDDSHEYHGADNSASRPGRGWIVVRARHLTPTRIIRAIRRGDFYASNGVVLQDVNWDESTGELQVTIKPEEDVRYKTQFIGTPAGIDTLSWPMIDDQGQPMEGLREYAPEIGQVLATQEGLTATYRLTGNELYVRAVVTSTKPHERPSFEQQTEQAWTQPVGWAGRVESK